MHAHATARPVEGLGVPIAGFAEMEDMETYEECMVRVALNRTRLIEGRSEAAFVEHIAFGQDGEFNSTRQALLSYPVT